MRVLRSGTALAALTLAAAGAAEGQTATQTVQFQVQAINEISVSGAPGTLTINAATAGSAPNSVSDNTTTWAVTTNEASKKVTASIGVAMPTGVTLSVSLGAPTGATSAGAVSLGTVAQDVVTGISTLNQSALGITYTLSATSAAGTVASTSRTVTFTITAGA